MIFRFLRLQTIYTYYTPNIKQYCKTVRVIVQRPFVFQAFVNNSSSPPASKKTRARPRIRWFRTRRTAIVTGNAWTVSPSCTTVRTVWFTRASSGASPRDVTIRGGRTTATARLKPVSVFFHPPALPQPSVDAGIYWFFIVFIIFPFFFPIRHTWRQRVIFFFTRVTAIL